MITVVISNVQDCMFDEMVNFCDENALSVHSCTVRYSSIELAAVFIFVDEDDATLFKLKFRSC